MNTVLPRVAIFDADEPPALAFVRSLGRAGVPLCVYCHHRWPMARFSRHCAAFRPCPDPSDVSAFLPWLRDRLRAGEFDLVAPTSDVQAFYLSEVHEQIAPGLRARLTAPVAIRDSLFKDAFDACCQAAQIPVPVTHYPESVQQAHEMAEHLRYPCILKPKSHVGTGLQRGRIVRSAAELRAEYAPYPIVPGRAPILEKHPSLLLPMTQAYVPRALQNLVSVSGVLDVDGRPLAAIATRKLLQWPPTLGVGIQFEALEDPALVERGVGIAEALLGRGLFELELVRDPDSGDWLAIDLNPRGHGFMALDIARGADLPVLWYRSVCGLEQPPAHLRNDLRWVHAVPFLARNLARLVKGPGRTEELRHCLEDLRTSSVDVVHDPEDPAPTLPFAARMLRHPGGLLRPFLSAGGDAR